MEIAGIITGGNPPHELRARPVLQLCSRVTAADSGLLHAASWKVRVQKALGDFDSFPGGVEQASKQYGNVETYPGEKDYSDTELALEEAYRQGFPRRILFGGGGGRIDHLLANLSLFHRDWAPDLWLSDDSTLVPLAEGNHYFSLGINRTVSFLPLQNLLAPIQDNSKSIADWQQGICLPQIQSEGLHWELDRVDWNNMPISLSNRTNAPELELKVIRGNIIMILPVVEGATEPGVAIVTSWRDT